MNPKFSPALLQTIYFLDISSYVSNKHSKLCMYAQTKVLIALPNLLLHSFSISLNGVRSTPSLSWPKRYILIPFSLFHSSAISWQMLINTVSGTVSNWLFLRIIPANTLAQGPPPTTWCLRLVSQPQPEVLILHSLCKADRSDAQIRSCHTLASNLPVTFHYT